MTKSYEDKREQLLSELQDIVDSAEQLVNKGSEIGADELSKLKKQFAEKSEGYRQQLNELRLKASEKVHNVAKQSDEFVHNNPYKAVGIAAGVAFLVGLLIINRK